MDSVEDDLKHIAPGLIWYKVPETAPPRPREKAFERKLQIVKVGGLFAIGVVAMSKDVQPGLDSPDLS